MFCPKCMEDIEPYDIYCCHCGTKLIKDVDDKNSSESSEGKTNSKFDTKIIIGIVSLVVIIFSFIVFVSQCTPHKPENDLLMERLYNNSNSVWGHISSNDGIKNYIGTSYDVCDKFATQITFFENNEGQIDYSYDEKVNNYPFTWDINENLELKITVYNELLDLENINGTYTYSDDHTPGTWSLSGGTLYIGEKENTCAP